MTDSRPSLTVVICTHDRRDLLLRTLRFLDQAALPPGWRIEVRVVANACSDDTLQALEGFAGRRDGGLPVTWMEVPVAGKSHALNQALPGISADLVAFVDDDHRVAADYLVSVCNAAERYPEAGLFCGRILPDWDGSEPAWVHDTGRYRIYPLPVPRFDQGDEPRLLTPEVAIPGGGNLFLRREWIARVGPFSTQLGPTGHDLGGSEDLDWVLRAQRLGARLQYVPSMIQYHYVDLDRLSLGYLMRKSYTRTASTVGLKVQPQSQRIPAYLFRKLGEYLFFALTSLATPRRRYYLVRTAAALGEIQGYRRWFRAAARACNPSH